jgi:hypothetical protein
MDSISLRKVKVGDKIHFAKWWRDKELLKLTSGILKLMSDKETDKYFQKVLHKKENYHLLITTKRKPIGHISFAKTISDFFMMFLISEYKF